MKTANPEITFVTPCYNDGNYIDKQVRSIQTQDYPNVKQIVVNDGSTDNSKKVLKKLEREFPNLTVINLKKNMGACYARNLGAKEAKGKYLSFLPADAKLYPGMARIWVETLEKNPEYDFLYGGYRFLNEKGESVTDYVSEPFNMHLFETNNFIDGSFPLKRELFEKMGGWDENIKSLQDWDFWLNAVKNHGAKPIYIADIYFETELPHAGGLSYDSHEHWIERTDQIKKKYGIPKRDICVTGAGAKFHGINIAKILDADYKDYPSHKPHEYKMIYIMGFFGPVAQSVFNTDALRVLHWVGSDVMGILNDPDEKRRQQAIFWIKNNIDINLTEFEHTQKELESVGIKSQICPLPTREIYDEMPLPKEFVVAVYDPYQNKQHYYPDMVKGLAQKMKSVKWKFFGDTSLIGEKDNIQHMGGVDDIKSFIKDTSCLLRVSKHDGLPISIMEWSMAGRNIVTNVPGIVGAVECKANEASIKKAIRKARKMGINKEGSKYYRELADHDKYKNFIYNLMKYDPKEYWNKRASAWHQIEGRVRDSKDEYIIGKEIDELVKGIENPKILDLGCGDGRWSDLLSQGNWQYKGVDISEKIIGFAKEKYPDLSFEVADIMKIDEWAKGEMFDVVFSYTSLLHIEPKDIEEAVKRLKKIGKNIVLIEPMQKPDLRGLKVRTLNPIIIEEQQRGNIIYGIKSSFVHDYMNLFDVEKVINLEPRTMIIAKL